MEDRCIKHVPDFIKNPCRQSVTTLQEMREDACNVVRTKGVSALSWDADELNEEFKNANERGALIGKMLAAAREHL